MARWWLRLCFLVCLRGLRRTHGLLLQALERARHSLYLQAAALQVLTQDLSFLKAVEGGDMAVVLAGAARGVLDGLLIRALVAACRACDRLYACAKCWNGLWGFAHLPPALPKPRPMQRPRRAPAISCMPRGPGAQGKGAPVPFCGPHQGRTRACANARCRVKRLVNGNQKVVVPDPSSTDDSDEYVDARSCDVSNLNVSEEYTTVPSSPCRESEV